MPFQKGNKLSKGRPKGIKSAKGDYWDNFKDYILDTGLKTVTEDFKDLSPKERIFAIINLMEFFKPKLSRNTQVNEVEKDTMHSLTGLYRQLADSKNDKTIDISILDNKKDKKEQ